MQNYHWNVYVWEFERTFHRKGFLSYKPNNGKIIFWLFLRAKEKNSTLSEMFFETQKLVKTYMFNKVSPCSKTKLSDTDSTRTKDCFMSASFSREKIVSAVILLKLVFEETLALPGGIKQNKTPQNQWKNPTEFSRSHWLFRSNTLRKMAR